MPKPNVQGRRESSNVSDEDSGASVDRELATSKFKDARLGTAFSITIELAKRKYWPGTSMQHVIACLQPPA